MDIKSKKFKEKYLITVLVLIISLFASIAVISSYSLIKKEAEAKVEKYNPYEDWQFLNSIYEGNYVLYLDNLEKKTSEVRIPSDTLLNPKNIEYLVDKRIISEGYYNEYDQDEKTRLKEEFAENIKYDFDNGFSEWKHKLLNLQNLEYLAIDKGSNTTISNSTDDLNLLYSGYKKEIESSQKSTEEIEGDNSTENLEDNKTIATKEELENIKNRLGFYTIIDFDNQGNIKVIDSYGVDKSKIEKLFREKEQSISDLKIEPIKNMTFIYGVPKELVHQDELYWNIKTESSYEYYNHVSLIVGIVSLIVVFIALISPYKKAKNILGFETIVKIPFEISAIIIVLAITFMYQGSVELIRMSVNGELVNSWIYMGLNIDISNIIVNAFNIIYWVIYFTIIFMSIIILKNIFKVGIKKYFISKTITGKIFVKSKSIIINIVKSIKETDFKEKPIKVILIGIMCNLIILCIISSLWFFGIFASIIYSVILFILIRKYYLRILDKYNKLLKYTNDIADGNLNTNIDENLGVFEPIKEKMSSIQIGFKKAVEEEVKSQGMKTELISNVSHDLKTPLTSIITYVDLLKDDNIDEKKRKLYIDTLDRKSQRLKVLIEDLFEMSKASSGNINLNIIDVDIVSLMKQTLLELNDQLSESSLKVKNSFPDNKVILPLDSQRTFRIFENLIMNICKYSMDNSRVYIDIIDNDSTVDIVLKNMSAVEIDFDVNDIVERFVRGDKSRNTEGSGLGLAIAKSFVELQNGKFKIDIDGDLFKVTITFSK
ncbi:MAG: sensor histidine kinase [Romboutsia sp.]|uniref:sensor histidine kinase n=1 Tax=Romboutsia sp. TaxID=1965302 RepID=UPI003F375547